MVRNADPGIQAVLISAPQQIVQRTISVLERKLDDAIITKPAAIDLVLSAVQIVDSGGLNWLLGAQSRLETLGIRLRLVDPSAIMADVLLATRLDSRFTVEVTGQVATTSGSAAGAAEGKAS